MGLPANIRPVLHTTAGSGISTRRSWRRALVPWLFLLPLLFMNVLVAIGPAFSAIYLAFTDWRGLGDANFIGLENFERLLNDPVYAKALSNNLKWLIIMLTVPITLGLAGAALLAGVRRFQTFYRVVYFLPSILAAVVIAQVWRSILNSNTGIGPWFAAHGLPFLNIPFFGTRTALYTVAFIDIWSGWGFLVVLYLAAMQAVDTELYEAARIEGANRWQEFRHVTLPGIRPTLAYTILTSIIGSFMVFAFPFILTQGGPAYATTTLSVLLFNNAFAKFQAGYAAAIGLTVSVFSGGAVLGFLLLRRRGWEI